MVKGTDSGQACQRTLPVAPGENSRARSADLFRTLRVRQRAVPVSRMFCAEVTEADQAAMALAGRVAEALSARLPAVMAVHRYLSAAEPEALLELGEVLADPDLQPSLALAIVFVEASLVDRFVAEALAQGPAPAGWLARLVRSHVTAKGATPLASPARLGQLAQSSAVLARHAAQTSQALDCLLEDRWHDAMACLEALPPPPSLAADQVLADLLWLSLMPTCETLELTEQVGSG